MKIFRLLADSQTLSVPGKELKLYLHFHYISYTSLCVSKVRDVLSERFRSIIAKRARLPAASCLFQLPVRLRSRLHQSQATGVRSFQTMHFLRLALTERTSEETNTNTKRPSSSHFRWVPVLLTFSILCSLFKLKLSLAVLNYTCRCCEILAIAFVCECSLVVCSFCFKCVQFKHQYVCFVLYIQTLEWVMLYQRKFISNAAISVLTHMSNVDIILLSCKKVY